MFSFLKRKNLKNDRKIQEINNQNQSNNKPSNLIKSSLSKNLEVIKQKTGNSLDIVIRQLIIGHNSKIKIARMVDNQSGNIL